MLKRPETSQNEPKQPKKNLGTTVEKYRFKISLKNFETGRGKTISGGYTQTGIQVAINFSLSVFY